LGDNLEITTEQIKILREESGAGIMECRNALKECCGDKAKALDYLQKQGAVKAQKTANRVVKQGVVTSYIHAGGRIGSLVELNTETDFVARTDEFKELARNIAMQVAAMDPQFVSKEDCPADTKVDLPTVCLLMQPYIKDPAKTTQDLITELISKTGENIKIGRFARFELGK
jgi:elongation factor Ts